MDVVLSLGLGFEVKLCKYRAGKCHLFVHNKLNLNTLDRRLSAVLTAINPILFDG